MSLENLVKSLQNDDNTKPLIKEWSRKIELAIDSIREQHKNVAEELEMSIFGSDRSTHRQ